MAHNIDISNIYKQVLCSDSSYDEYMLTREEVTEIYKLLLYISWHKMSTQDRYEIINKLTLLQYKPPNSRELFEIVDHLQDEEILDDDGNITI